MKIREIALTSNKYIPNVNRVFVGGKEKNGMQWTKKIVYAGDAYFHCLKCQVTGLDMENYIHCLKDKHKKLNIEF